MLKLQIIKAGLVLASFILIHISLQILSNKIWIGNQKYFGHVGNHILKPTSGPRPILIKSYSNQSLKGKGVIYVPRGGLGNQLYGYACHYAIARDTNRPLYIFITGQTLNSSSREFLPHQRPFSLDKFQIPINYIDNNTKINPNSMEEFDKTHLSSRKFPDKNFLRMKKKVFCHSERYWGTYKDDILDMFQMRPEVIQGFQPYVKQVERKIQDAEHSVCVHVRRGDFKILNRSLSISFQRKAIRNMSILLKQRQSSSPPKYFLFSDDMKYVREKLRDMAKSHDFYFVSSNSGNRTTSLEDFYLMTKCKHFIIPNSTFSRWAAYLSKDKKDDLIPESEKIVISAKSPVGYKDTYKIKINNHIIM